jgi:4-amino-4-deoxy-L-arabinose transferase-like glycosyltransferase
MGNEDRERAGRRARRWLWGIALLALAARVVAVLWYSDRQQVYYEYMLIARNLLSGHGYSLAWDLPGAVLEPTSLFPPLYVYWCAFWMWLARANFVWLYLAQAAVSALGVWPAYQIARRLFDSRAGLIAALLYAGYPELAYLPVRPVPEFAYVAGGLWAIWLYYRLIDAGAGGRAPTRIVIGCGLLCGVLLLIKESALLLLAAILLALIWRGRSWWKSAAWIAVMVLAVLSPWLVRNAVVQERFIPLRTGYGYNLWIGNNPAATGLARTEEGDWVVTSQQPEYAEYLRANLPAREYERDEFFGREAIRYIVAHPARFGELCAARLGYLIGFVPGHPLTASWFYRGPYLLLCALALPTVYLLWRARRLDPVFPLIWLFTILMYVPVMVQPRYRVLVIATLLVLIPGLLSGALPWRTAKPRASAIS